MKTWYLVFGFILSLIGLAFFVVFLSVLQQYSSSLAQLGLLFSKDAQSQYELTMVYMILSGSVFLVGLLSSIYGVTMESVRAPERPIPTEKTLGEELLGEAERLGLEKTEETEEPKADEGESVSESVPESLKCPKCAMSLLQEFNLCPYCGFSLIQNTCVDCGREISAEFSICPYCGANLKKQRDRAIRFR